MFKKKTKTIVICSSASFYKQVIAVAKELRTMGFKVATPLTAGKMERSGDYRVETYKTWFKDSNAYSRKAFLTRHHFSKIAKGNYVLVLNYEKNGIVGYIGGAVLAEMAVAFHLRKKIFVLNPVDEKLQYIEEIFGMQPVFLDGKLENIK